MKTIKNKLLMFAMLASGCSLQGAEGGEAAAGAAEGLYPLDPSITDTELGLGAKFYFDGNIEKFKIYLRSKPQDEQKAELKIPMISLTRNFAMSELAILQSLGVLNFRTQATKIDVKGLQEVVAVQQGQITTLTETVAQQQTQIAEQRAQIGVLMTLFAARLGQGPA